MHPLKKIYIEITNACNLACSFCRQTDRPRMFLSVADFTRIIHKIKPHTSYVYLHVLGEPLLHRDLGALLDICAQNDVKASITTNATLIKTQKPNIVNKPALRQVNYSLHSLFEQPGDYREILRDIHDFITAADSAVYHCLRFWNLDSETAAQNNRLTDELSALFGGTVVFPEGLTKGHGIRLCKNVFVQQQRRFVWPSVGGKEIFTRGRCGGLRHDAGILADGSVVPCCLDGNGDMVLGNIYRNSLAEILRSKRARDIQESFEKHTVIEKLCRTCGFANQDLT